MADAAKHLSLDSDMKELREEFTYAQDAKRLIVEEGAEDMRVIGGDVWDPKDRRAREEAERPVLSLDEAGQYVNQLINGIRQNKRSIRVAPQGRNATEKTAELRQNLIRQTEYRSNAQQAYAVMAENAFQRSYGYLRVVPEFVNHESFDQELRIKGVPNPDLVTEDPSAQRTDGGDWQFLYFGEEWSKPKFKRKWPRAQAVSFEMAAKLGASNWIKADRVLVAERWRIVTKPRTLLLVQPAATTQPGLSLRAPVIPMPYTVFEDALEGGKLPLGASVLKKRKVDYPSVKKQITNGIEILEEVDFPGTSIPFVACYGKVIYVNEQKRILSLIRLARDPMMLYCFYRTQQAEMASMIPKVPVMGYKGQFAGVEGDWQRAPHEPLAFIEAGIPEGWNHGWGPPPLPQRLAYSAGEHLQALELCAEGARRAIQAAIGSSPLPTQAQRRNEKSGIALQTIESAEERGSFHFIDHFDDALMRTGAILDELIPHYYDTARKVTVRDSQDQPDQVRINDPADPEAVSAVDGDHDVTLSVGPYQASERQAASDFADTLIGSQLIQLMPPPLALKIVAMAVRLKAVGPIGDEIADLLSPKDADQQQGPSPQQIQQMEGQIQELTAKLQQAAQALESDQAKEQARVEIEKIKADVAIELQAMKDATAIRVKEIDAEIKGLVTGHAAQHEAAALHTELAHDAAQAERDRRHEAGLAAMSAEHQAQAAERNHGQQLEASEIEAQRAAEQAAADAAVGGA